MRNVGRLCAVILGGLCLSAATLAPPVGDWQAIAVRDDGRVFGMSQVHNQLTADGAIALARQNCVTNHGGTCRVLVATRGCGAVAYNETTLSFFGETGPDQQSAIRNAYALCAREGGGCDKALPSCPFPAPN